MRPQTSWAPSPSSATLASAQSGATRPSASVVISAASGSAHCAAMSMASRRAHPAVATAGASVASTTVAVTPRSASARNAVRAESSSELLTNISTPARGNRDSVTASASMQATMRSPSSHTGTATTRSGGRLASPQRRTARWRKGVGRSSRRGSCGSGDQAFMPRPSAGSRAHGAAATRATDPSHARSRSSTTRRRRADADPQPRSRRRPRS